MNSFRVVDTRFRILKGGKIGLSMSIALISGMLTLGSTKANAVDYFTNVQKDASVLKSDINGFFDVTVETATNTGTFDLDRSSTNNDSVVFKPSSWVSSSYNTPSFVGDYDTNSDSTADYSSYLLKSTSSTEQLTLTFTTNANAGSISKDNTTVYSAPSTSIVNITSNSTYNLNTSTSTGYTANLIFKGSNKISGSTNIGDGNIKLEGSVIFDDTVNAGSISVDNASTITFNSDVDLTAGTTDSMNFSVNENVLLNKDFTGNITTTAGNQGNVTILGNASGKEQIIKGNIGTSTSLDINTLNIGSGTNYSRTIIDGDVFAASTILNNTTINSSTLILSNDKNITSTITTSSDNKGILTLSGGTQAVNGQIGTNANKLAEINANGSTGKTVTFANNVFATNLDLEGAGTVNLNGDYTGTALRYNEDGIVNLADTKNITSAVTTDAANQGTLNLAGSSTVSGLVGDATNKLKEINANGSTGKTVTFANNVFATNLDLEGAGTVNLNGDYTGTALRYNEDGIVNLADTKNITSAVTTDANNQGTLNLAGSSTISGLVGDATNKLKEINANGSTGKTVNFTNNVFATSTNVNSGEIKFDSDLTSDVYALNPNSGILTFVGDASGKTQNIMGNIGNPTNSISILNIGEAGSPTDYSSTIINGNVFVNSTVLNNATGDSTLTLANGSNINSTITTAQNAKGILTFLGDSTATGTIGTNTEKLAQINAADTGKTVRFNSSINADNLNILGDGTVVLADNSNINTPITTTTNNEGTLTFKGNSTATGEIGSVSHKLKEINAGASGKTVSFENPLYALNTNISSGIVNFNTTSGDTSSNIVFQDTGTANLNGDLIGNINFSGKEAIVNVADGKGILGSVETLAINNTGIINYKGDGTIGGNIGSLALGIKELNINTNSEQDTPNGVLVTYSALGRELYADVINLKKNATLTLSDNVNMINTAADNIIIKVDTTNTGTLAFLGDSSIKGEVGESNKVLNTINAGASGKTVTFDDMVYASSLKYSDDGKVVLNGDTSSDTSEGMIGNVDFDSNAGTLEIGDDVNITIAGGGIEFANNKNATLAFNGTSNVKGIVGSENGVNDTFKTINVGATGKVVNFDKNVYVMDSLNLSSNGKVQIADGMYVKRNSTSATTGAIITASTDEVGDLEYLGTTTLYDDIGTSAHKLNNVIFASNGTIADTYNQDIDKNIYAVNTILGNGLNKTTVNIKDDMTFGGNLELKSGSTLDVNDKDVIVSNNININSESNLKFKVYTTDLSAGQAVVNEQSGSITASSLTIANDAKIDINYQGSWEDTGKYNLITSSSVLGTYYGTEENGLVSDNSIIDSIVEINGNNLVLKADRTGGGAFAAEDIYTIISGIGNDYSNGASKEIGRYAKTPLRDGALTDIVLGLDKLNGGRYASEAKKQEMIKTFRLLAPIANSSNIQTTITASNLASSTISGRLADIKRDDMANFSPDYTGLSSGDYGFDSSLWIKAMGSKSTQDGINEYTGFSNTTYGFVAGMDKITDNDSVFGVALGYSTTKTDQDNEASDSSDTKSIQATVYASKEFENAYVDGSLSYSQHKTDGTRTANSGKLTSSVDSDQIAAKVETGYTIPIAEGVSITPFASLEYALINQKGYTEKGTAYQNDALKVDSLKLNKGTVQVGAKVTTSIELENVLIKPQFRASVYNTFGDNKADIKAQYIGGGNKFVTPVQELNKTMYNVGFGVETKISESTSLIFDVDYDRSKDGKFEAYSGNVTFGLSF